MRMAKFPHRGIDRWQIIGVIVELVVSLEIGKIGEYSLPFPFRPERSKARLAYIFRPGRQIVRRKRHPLLDGGKLFECPPEYHLTGEVIGIPDQVICGCLHCSEEPHLLCLVLQEHVQNLVDLGRDPAEQGFIAETHTVVTQLKQRITLLIEFKDLIFTVSSCQVGPSPIPMRTLGRFEEPEQVPSTHPLDLLSPDSVPGSLNDL